MSEIEGGGSAWAGRSPGETRRFGLTWLDLVRAALIVGVPFIVVYVPESNGAFVGAGAVLMVAVRFARVPRALEAGFVLGLAVAVWANPLGLYEASEAFGLAVHFVMSALDGPTIFLGLVAYGVLDVGTTGRRLAGAFITMLAISVTIGAGWEVIEWSSDSVFETTLLGSQRKMALDLLVDTLGGLVGAACAVAYLRGATGTARSTTSGK